MKKNLTVWKRTISSVAALAIVLSLGAPLTAYGVEYPVSSPTSPAAQSETGTDTQTANWEETAVKAIGTAAGKDAVEKIYNYLRNLEGHKDAQSFQTLAAKPAYGVTCKTIKGKLSGADHSWNAVQLDGAWYTVDVEKGVLLAGSKTLLADGKTAFGSAYVSSETENKTVLSEDNYKISITITPAASTKVYGDNDPAFTYNASDKTVVLEGNISRTNGNDVGEYAYTLGDLKVKEDTAKAGQYKLVLAANAPKFKVTARPLAIKEVVLQQTSETVHEYETTGVPVSQIALENIAPGDSGTKDVYVNINNIKAEVSDNKPMIYNSFTISGITLEGEKAKNYTIDEKVTINKTFEIKQPEPPAVVTDEGKKDETTSGSENSEKKDESNSTSNDNTEKTDSTVNPSGADKEQTPSGDSNSNPNSNSDKNSSPTTSPDGTPSESQKPDNPQSGTGSENTPPTTSSTPDGANPPSDGQTTTDGKTVVTITVDSLEKIYGEDDPEPKFTSSLEIELTGELSREPGTDAGTYEYTLGTLAPVSQDYKLELASNHASLTIHRQEVTVAIPNQYKYYGEEDKPIKYTLSRYIDVEGKVTREEGTATGKKYKYSIDQLKLVNENDQKNFVLVMAENVGYFEILPPGAAMPSQKVQVFVTPDSKEKVFGETDPEPTYKLSQAIAVKGTLGRKSGQDAGTYAYTLEGLIPESDLFELVLADTQSPAALTIHPKTIEVTFQPQSKTYGEKDPTPAYTLGETIEVKGTPSRESGEDVANGHLYPYTLGTLAAVSRNYKLVAADNGAALTITPRTVDILFRRPASNDVEFNYASGMAYVEHDGKAKQVDAFYQTARGEESKVSILYNGSSEAPKDQGIYNISVSIEDPNYLISDKELSITQMMIRQKTFSAVDVSRTVSKDDTSRKFVPLTQFGVPANAFQYVYVYNMEGDYIFGNTPEIKNGNLYYQLRSDLSAGMESSIILRLLENNSYGFNEFRLKVAVGEQGFEITVQNPPSKVTLGSDINIASNFRLVTKYDGGNTVTENITQDMLSGYNKSATGNDSIGKKAITVTSKKHSGTASFVITVEDRITGLEVGAPDQLEYSTGDSRLDLSGGWVAMKMQSGIPQSRRSLTMSMLNVTNSILNKAGSYPVRVTYNNYSLARAFTIEVERSSMNWSDGDWYPVDSRPDSGDFGLSLDTDNLKGSHDKEDIHLVVGEVTGSEYYDLDDYMEDRSVDDYEIMDLSLYDSYKDENVEIRSGYITILIPYPSNTSSSKHNFTVYHLVNGRVRTEAVTTQSSHLKISVNSLSPFAVAWKRKSSGISNSGGSSGGSGNLSDAIQHQREMDEFWDDVSDTLGDTNPGRAVLVDAGDYDYFPSRVLNSIRNRDVTLKIQNDNTKTIVLNGKEIPSKSSLETSYTMSELYKLAQGLSSSSSSSGSRPSGNTSGSLEDLWEDVVKSLKSYQDGTTITINAKDNSAVPKTVLDAIRGRNITMKLKSDDYPQMTINGLELPVGLESKKQYSLNELYNASVPASVSDLESLWSDVVESLKSYKSGARVTINAGNNTFIPETLLDAIRGRNVTVDMKSDYTSQMITLNGSSMPRSLSGERYYTISQLVNRAKSGGNIIQVPNTGNPEQGNSNTNNVTNNNTSNIGGNTAGTSSRPASSAVLPQGGIQQGSSSQAQSSAVSSPSGTVGVSSSSSQSSSKVVEPPSVTINPPLNGQDGETIPSIEATEQTSSILPKVIIGIMVLAILVVVGLLVFLLGGKRSH